MNLEWPIIIWKCDCFPDAPIYNQEWTTAREHVPPRLWAVRLSSVPEIHHLTRRHDTETPERPCPQCSASPRWVDERRLLKNDKLSRENWILSDIFVFANPSWEVVLSTFVFLRCKVSKVPFSLQTSSFADATCRAEAPVITTVQTALRQSCAEKIWCYTWLDAREQVTQHQRQVTQPPWSHTRHGHLELISAHLRYPHRWCSFRAFASQEMSAHASGYTKPDSESWTFWILSQISCHQRYEPWWHCKNLLIRLNEHILLLYCSI